MICATCEAQTTTSPCSACGQDALLIGKYRLERVLGRGAQGTTFLAQGPTGTCAIKELHLGRAGVGKRAELIHREAAVLEQISHPNIPTLHEHFVHGVGVGRSLYLVQDHIQGQNLEERLKTHRFTEAEVTDIVTQAAAILTTLHGLSPPVIHRDIKPSNLMIDNDGAVHLIDFGSVRDVMRDTVGGGSTVAGTFGYMPPEQLVGDATPQSDIYALGMTAVRLLTRQNPAELTDRTGQLTWKPHANVGPKTEQWVDAMVQHSPKKRASAKQISRGPDPFGIQPSADIPQAAPPVVPQAAPPVVPSPTEQARPTNTPQWSDLAGPRKASVRQSGTHVIQFTVPTKFSFRDVQRVVHMAVQRKLLPANISIKRVGHSGALFHVSNRADGLPIGSEPYLVVQVQEHQTTLLLQPQSNAKESILAIVAACGLFALFLTSGPISQISSMGSDPSLVWWVLCIIGITVAIGVGAVGGMRPQVKRRNAVDHLRDDITQEWARKARATPLTREPIRGDSSGEPRNSGHRQPTDNG